MRTHWKIWLVDDISANVSDPNQALPAELSALLCARKSTVQSDDVWRPEYEVTEAGAATIAYALKRIDEFDRNTFPDVAILDIRLDGVRAGTNTGDERHRSIGGEIRVPDENSARLLAATVERIIARLKRRYETIGGSIYRSPLLDVEELPAKFMPKEFKNKKELASQIWNSWQQSERDSLEQIRLALRGEVPKATEFLAHGGWFIGQLLLERANELSMPAPDIVYYSGSHTAISAMLPAVVGAGQIVFQTKGSLSVAPYVVWLLKQRALSVVRAHRSEAVTHVLNEIQHAVGVNVVPVGGESSRAVSRRQRETAHVILDCLHKPVFAGRTLASLRSDLLSECFAFLASGTEITEDAAAMLLNEVKSMLESPGACLRSLMTTYPGQNFIHWCQVDGQDVPALERWGYSREMQGRIPVNKVFNRPETDDIRQCVEKHIQTNIQAFADAMAGHLRFVDPTVLPNDVETRIRDVLGVMAIKATAPALTNLDRQAFEQIMTELFDHDLFSVPSVWTCLRELGETYGWEPYQVDPLNMKDGTYRLFLLTRDTVRFLLGELTLEAYKKSATPNKYFSELIEKFALGKRAGNSTSMAVGVKIQCLVESEPGEPHSHRLVRICVHTMAASDPSSIVPGESGGDFGQLLGNPWLGLTYRRADGKLQHVNPKGGWVQAQSGNDFNMRTPEGFAGTWIISCRCVVRGG